jgi:ABC-type nitrate/sulfonate/bicarbonate transport system ATPase subunit
VPAEQSSDRGRSEQPGAAGSPGMAGSANGSVRPVASGAALPGAGTSSAGIRLKGVGKRFGNVVALRGIDFEIERHSRIGIVGPSGGGKSTLLHIVSGLMEPDAGEVDVEGATSAKDRLARCAMMPQRDLLLPWRTALDNAIIALENRGVSRKEARAQTRPYFERFGLDQFENVRPAQLSGGMRQRVSFMRTLVAGKDVLLLDEPFGALDSITRAQMQEWLLRALSELPRTVLLVTHDVEEALLLSRTVVVMSARPGRVVRTLAADFPTDVSRREIVTSREFVDLKEQALEAIG